MNVPVASYAPSNVVESNLIVTSRGSVGEFLTVDEARASDSQDYKCQEDGCMRCLVDFSVASNFGELQ